MTYILCRARDVNSVSESDPPASVILTVGFDPLSALHGMLSAVVRAAATAAAAAAGVRAR